MLIDVILFQLAFLLAYVVRNGMNWAYYMDTYKSGAIILALMNICIGFFRESYKDILKRGYWQEFRAVVNHVLMVTVAIISYFFVMKMSAAVSRTTMIFFPIFSILLLFGGRVLRKLYLRTHKGTEKEKRSMILVGYSESYKNMVDTFLDNPYSDFRVAGIGLLDNRIPTEEIYRDIPVIKGEEEILETLKVEWVDEVFIDLPRGKSLHNSLTDKCETMGITVHIKLASLEDERMNQMVETIEGNTVLSTSIMMASPSQLFLKRIMDICGGIVGLILTGILTIIIGPMIYLKSPGPIFFSQVRIGKNGRKFKIYKFRSMYMDAEERKIELMDQNNIKDGMMFKMDDDPRIIKGIGHFIRNYSLDEFPQFWNVLKGDMSLVGTRPPTVDEWEKYEYHHRSRLAVKPGLTGLWQVSGRSKITDFEEVVKLDRKYIQKWSTGQDIKILLKTVGAVLAKEGSM